MRIDEVQGFPIEAAIEDLTQLWGWLGKDAAQEILDCLSPHITQVPDRDC